MGLNLVRKEFLNDGTWTCPAGVSQIRAVATAYGFSLVSGGIAVGASGAAYAWGAGTEGQLGDNTLVTKSSPVVVAGGVQWRQILGFNVVGSTGLGIAANGDGYAWGRGNSGQLGNGTATAFQQIPAAIAGTYKWRQMDGGATQTIGIAYGGDAYAWGRNAEGQLGDGTVIWKSSPVLVLGSRAWRMVAISKLGYHTMGIDTSGDLYAWGLNANGQLGVGDVIARSTPVLVLGGLKFTSVALGTFSSHAITAAGDIYSWGHNANGQLGDGTIIARSSPTLTLGAKKWRFLSAGDGTAVAIDGTGVAYAWGKNTNGQLGTSDVASRSSPVAVTGGNRFNQVYASYDSTYGLDYAARVYAWGNNVNGQLGDGTVIAKSAPVAVAGSYRYKTDDQVIVNSVTIPVVPGTVYQILIYGGTVSFGYKSLYQDPYPNASTPVKLTLEYQA